jgi:hypothetical protein
VWHVSAWSGQGGANEVDEVGDAGAPWPPAYFASLPEEARADLPARIVETLELIEPSRDSCGQALITGVCLAL